MSTSPTGPADRLARPATPAPPPDAPGDAAKTDGTAAPGSPTRPNRPAPRKPEGPRRVRRGVKLQARDGVIPATFLSQPWLTLLAARVPDEEFTTGVEYARAGQTVSIEIIPGGVEAMVQGMKPRPQKVEIRFPTLTTDQWDRAIDAMASEAIYAARLQAGELPESAVELFAAQGLELMPADAASITFPRQDPPDRLVSTVGHLLAERLVREPTVIFTLRGMAADRVVDRLGQLRTIQAHGEAAAHIDPLIPESQQAPEPLDACLDDFWRCGPSIGELENTAPPQHAEQALVRRLGPSPMSGRFPMVGLLASIYDQVRDEAITLRDRAQAPPPPDE